MNKIAEAPLVDLFAIIGEELAEAASCVEDLHAVVEAAVKDSGTSHAFLQRAQTIDLLQQRLFALSEFISDLTKALPATWCVDNREALANVKLSRLRERLSRNCLDIEMGHTAGDLQML